MDKLKNVFEGRSWWMNGVMLFCVFMTFMYMPFDMFYKPVAQDQEVWFGFVLTGWAAKATEPIHWLIYGFGLYGFHRMKPWMWPWASLYVAQVAIGMFAWSVMSDKGGGMLMGSLVAAPFIVLAVALFMSKDQFTRVSNEGTDSEQNNL